MKTYLQVAREQGFDKACKSGDLDAFQRFFPFIEKVSDHQILSIISQNDAQMFQLVLQANKWEPTMQILEEALDSDAIVQVFLRFVALHVV